MDELLSRASNQAMTFAIRSSITFASGFAFKTLSKLLDKIPEAESHPIHKSKAKLDLKINSVMGLIAIIKIENSSRNSVLKPTIDLIADLEKDIEIFDNRMREVMETTGTRNTKESIKLIELELANLHSALNETIPFINLALSATGVDIKSMTANNMSISYLLRASRYFVRSQQITKSEHQAVGPQFDFVFYSVFYNPSRLKYVNDSSDSLSALTWKEEYARCSVQLQRRRDKVSDRFNYILSVKENFEDGLYHEAAEPQERVLSISSIVSQYFTASGRLLRLETSNSPIIVLKVSNRAGYDYIAFSTYEKEDSDDETDESGEEDGAKIGNSSTVENTKTEESTDGKRNLNLTLGLFQYLIRLSAIEECEQANIFDIPDEKLMLLLRNETSGRSVLNPSPHKPSIKHSGLEQDLTLESNTQRLKSLEITN